MPALLVTDTIIQGLQSGSVSTSRQRRSHMHSSFMQGQHVPYVYGMFRCCFDIQQASCYLGRGNEAFVCCSRTCRSWHQKQAQLCQASMGRTSLISSHSWLMLMLRWGLGYCCVNRCGPAAAVVVCASYAEQQCFCSSVSVSSCKCSSARRG